MGNENRHGEAIAMVPAAAIVTAMSAALAKLARDMDALLDELGRENQWPDAYVRKVKARYGDVRRATVADLSREFAAPMSDTSSTDCLTVQS